MTNLGPGTERAIFNISQELPRLTEELAKLNKLLSAPSEAKKDIAETLKSFREDLLRTFRGESETEKLVQE
jgi:hypothetical protein